MQDQEFLEAFEACTLQGEFHHAAHVRVAWLMLRQAPLEDALARFSRGLRRFAEHKGAHGLYHQTITWLYLFVINERMAETHGDLDWEGFASENPDLLADHRAFLGRYYTEDVLKSDLARAQFVLPNRGLAAQGGACHAL